MASPTPREEPDEMNCSEHMHDLIAGGLSMLRYANIGHMLTCDENSLFGKFHLEAGLDIFLKFGVFDQKEALINDRGDLTCLHRLVERLWSMTLPLVPSKSVCEQRNAVVITGFPDALKRGKKYQALPDMVHGLNRVKKLA